MRLYLGRCMSVCCGLCAYVAPRRNTNTNPTKPCRPSASSSAHLCRLGTGLGYTYSMTANNNAHNIDDNDDDNHNDSNNKFDANNYPTP